MADYWWFCAIGPSGQRRRVAHAVKDGKALCNTPVAHGTRSFSSPEGARATGCLRCLKAMAKLRLTQSPKEIHLRLMTWQGDSFHALEVDGQFYYFNYKWWCAKLAGDPDDWAVGARVPKVVLSQYVARPINNAPAIQLSQSWVAPC